MNWCPHKKSRTIFTTNRGSRNIYSRAKVNARAHRAPKPFLYSINGHLPPIADDRLKEGQASILCMSNMSNKVINPLMWPEVMSALLLCFQMRRRGVVLWSQSPALPAERGSQSQQSKRADKRMTEFFAVWRNETKAQRWVDGEWSWSRGYFCTWKIFSPVWIQSCIELLTGGTLAGCLFGHPALPNMALLVLYLISGHCPWAVSQEH